VSKDEALAERLWSRWPHPSGVSLLDQWAWVQPVRRAYPWHGSGRVQWRWVVGTVAQHYGGSYELGDARGWADSEDEAKGAVRAYVEQRWAPPPPKPYAGAGTW
jgi:hypothetical protein